MRLLAILLLLASSRPAAAERVAERYTRQGLIRPLLQPGQSLAAGIEVTAESSQKVNGALEWRHFAGRSRLTGDRVVGVVQRWALPAKGLTPADVLACLLEGGTTGRDGQGPRFLVKAARQNERWHRAGGAAALFDPEVEAAIIRADNIRPRVLSGLYHPNAFNMVVDRRRVFVSDDHAEVEGQLMNPSRQRGPLPGKQHGLLRLSARRLSGGRIEFCKEYVAVAPTSFIATAAPVMKPVSALMSLWSSVPRVLRDYTPAGVAVKMTTAVGTTLTDIALGKQLENLILDRHSDMLHSVAIPNLTRALSQRTSRGSR